MKLEALIEIFDLTELTITPYKEKPMAEIKPATDPYKAPEQRAAAAKPATPAPKGKNVVPASFTQYTTSVTAFEEMKKFKDNFAFDNEQERHPFFILLSSLPKIGKTHLACTVSEFEPAYLLDTEHKGGDVAKKFTPTKNMKYKRIMSYIEMVAAVRYIVQNCPKGCIIIDSGSDLQNFAEEMYLIENNRDTVGLPRNWADVFSKCNAIIKDVKAAGFDLILTTRMKDEWKNNVATGKAVPRIWENALYLSDIAVEWDDKKQPWIKLNALQKQAEPVPMQSTTIKQLLTEVRQAVAASAKAA